MSARRTLYWVVLCINLGSLLSSINAANLVGVLACAIGLGALLVSWPRGDA